MFKAALEESHATAPVPMQIVVQLSLKCAMCTPKVLPSGDKISRGHWVHSAHLSLANAQGEHLRAQATRLRGRVHGHVIQIPVCAQCRLEQLLLPVLA